MKYAHLGDLHLGAWRYQKMRDLSTKAFLTAIDRCIELNVDFILFTGDLFNTSLPSLDTLKIVTKKLKELQDKNIPVYTIAGSHDFSPSGKTMIDVLESAGLLTNVCKGKVNPETKELQLRFTIDRKTGARITGVLGRRGLLDKTYYENLERESLEREPGYKIFMFHTTISELLPEHLAMMESQPISIFPQRFNYYAGGHIHHPTKKEIEGYGTITYSGALFPNNFQEIEKYGHGGFYVIDVDHGFPRAASQHVEWIPVKIAEHIPLVFDCTGKSPDTVASEILTQLERDVTNCIITLRLKGTVHHGKAGEINFKDIFEQLYIRGAYFVLRNTAKLQSEEFEEVRINENTENIEETIIAEHLQQTSFLEQGKEKQLTHDLLIALNTTKQEGENSADFQARIEAGVSRLFEVDEKG
ncbi:exonuclease SbcCD subunit D [Candidatus Woesearchaeota archaeon]|nr:exonuclease SbcCD subunit D [Candidatus Woesearchaeota archaeon]